MFYQIISGCNKGHFFFFSFHHPRPSTSLTSVLPFSHYLSPSLIPNSPFLISSSPVLQSPPPPQEPPPPHKSPFPVPQPIQIQFQSPWPYILLIFPILSHSPTVCTLPTSLLLPLSLLATSFLYLSPSLLFFHYLVHCPPSSSQQSSLLLVPVSLNPWSRLVTTSESLKCPAMPKTLSTQTTSSFKVTMSSPRYLNFTPRPAISPYSHLSPRSLNTPVNPNSNS